MKKKNIFLLLLLLITSMTTACGVDNNKSLSNVEEDMIKITDFHNMKKATNKDIRRFYNINIHDYDEVILYKPKSTMDVNEVLMVKVSDKSQIDSLKDSIDSRITYQLNSFGSYGPKQCALVDNYELKSKSNFLIFAISENAEEIKDAFLDSISK